MYYVPLKKSFDLSMPMFPQVLSIVTAPIPQGLEVSYGSQVIRIGPTPRKSFMMIHKTNRVTIITHQNRVHHALSVGIQKTGMTDGLSNDHPTDLWCSPLLRRPPLTTVYPSDLSTLNISRDVLSSQNTVIGYDTS